MANLHSQAIPDDTLVQAATKIEEVKALLSPYFVTLTATERRDMLKMGEKSLGFVERANGYAKKSSELVPPYLNMEEFDIDYADTHNLWGLRNSIAQLHEGIDDTVMCAGSEAYQAALLFYTSVKVAAAHDVPGAKAIYEELKQRFPSTRRKSSETEA
jgi:hypothetical protein